MIIIMANNQITDGTMIMSVRHYDLLRAPRTGEVADVINVSRVRVKPNRLIDKSHT